MMKAPTVTTKSTASTLSRIVIARALIYRKPGYLPLE
jgi:hypothetical protein